MAGLSSRQLIMLVTIGVVLWFAAAMALRALASMGIYDGMARLWLYGLIIPGTVPFVPLTAWIAGVGRNQLALAMSVVTASAVLLDGVAVAWFPGLYGSNLPDVLGAAAAILWGGGVAIWLGFLLNQTKL